MRHHKLITSLGKTQVDGREQTTTATMDWHTEKALLTVSRGPHDNRWDMLPIEIRTMIIALIKGEDEAKARAYWKVCFNRILGHLIYFTRCQCCGDSKIPTMNRSKYKVASDIAMMICRQNLRYLTHLSSEAFDSFNNMYWKGDTSVWKMQ